MKTLSCLLLTASLALTACGAPPLDDAVAALQASFDGGSYAEVLEGAPAVLERCGAEEGGEAKAWKVEKLRVLALGKLGRGTEAAKDLTRLKAAYAGKVKAELYAQVGGYVTEAGEYTEAIAVLDAGVKAFPDKKAALTPQISDLSAKASAAGDDSAIAALKALGYL